jgi:hypothetical protein
MADEAWRAQRMLAVIAEAQVPGLHNLRAGQPGDGPLVHFDIGRWLQGGAAGSSSRDRYYLALGVRPPDGPVTREILNVLNARVPAAAATADTITGIGPAITALAAGMRTRYPDLDERTPQ